MSLKHKIEELDRNQDHSEMDQQKAQKKIKVG